VQKVMLFKTLVDNGIGYLKISKRKEK